MMFIAWINRLRSTMLRLPWLAEVQRCSWFAVTMIHKSLHRPPMTAASGNTTSSALSVPCQLLSLFHFGKLQTKSKANKTMFFPLLECDERLSRFDLHSSNATTTKFEFNATSNSVVNASPWTRNSFDLWFQLSPSQNTIKLKPNGFSFP